MVALRTSLSLLALAAVAPASAVLAPWPGVATNQLNISVTPSFLASGVVTFNMAVEKTFAADSARFVFHGPTAQPSSPTWTDIFTANNWNSNKCNYMATLNQQGQYATGGVTAATTGSFDMSAFCTDAVCPGSLVQDCGFGQGAGLLDPANLRYFGKVEVWLANADHQLLVGFYNVAIELPLTAQAVAGDSLPITVTLNTNLVTVNTTVTGLGLLKSYLMLCPGQDVPQQLAGGNVIGTLTDATSVTNVYVGETYCIQHVVPNLPGGVTLTAHSLFQNGTEVPTVPAYPGTGIFAYNNFTSGMPVYGSIVQFFYTFTDRGLNTFSSTVNFTAPAARFAGALPSTTFQFVSMPLSGGGALASGAARVGTALRTATTEPATTTTATRASARGLLQAGGSYAQASALALFSPVEKNNAEPTPAAPTGVNWFST